MKTSMELCSKFKNCSSPKCPLDIDARKRVRLAEDPECKLELKETRKIKREAKNLNLL